MSLSETMNAFEVLWRDESLDSQMPGAKISLICEVEKIEPYIYSTKELYVVGRTQDCFSNPFNIELYFFCDDRPALYKLWNKLFIGHYYLAEGFFCFDDVYPYVRMMGPNLFEVDKEFVKANKWCIPDQVTKFEIDIDMSW